MVVCWEESGHERIPEECCLIIRTEWRTLPAFDRSTDTEDTDYLIRRISWSGLVIPSFGKLDARLTRNLDDSTLCLPKY
ncbi:unnamed protein product [Calypogeia fissa]